MNSGLITGIILLFFGVFIAWSGMLSRMSSEWVDMDLSWIVSVAGLILIFMTVKIRSDGRSAAARIAGLWKRGKPLAKKNLKTLAKR